MNDDNRCVRNAVSVVFSTGYAESQGREIVIFQRGVDPRVKPGDDENV
jgi:hypothetical protein